MYIVDVSATAAVFFETTVTMAAIYRVGQKTWHSTFIHMFANY